MPARLQTGVAYRGGQPRRATRRAARTQRRLTRAPAYQGRQRSYRRYYRKQVGPAKNVGKAINRQVRQKQHRQRLAGHRRRVERKTQREIKRKRELGKSLNARERRIVDAQHRRKNLLGALGASSPSARRGGMGRAVAQQRLSGLLEKPKNRRELLRMADEFEREARRTRKTQRDLLSAHGTAYVGTKRKGRGVGTYEFLTQSGQKKLDPDIRRSAEARGAKSAYRLHRKRQREELGRGYFGKSETARGAAEIARNPSKGLRQLAYREAKVQTSGLSDVPSPTIIGKAAVQTARATYERPGKTASSTVKSLGPLLAGLIPGVAEAVTDPAKAAKAIQADYKRRYGPLTKGQEKAFRKRIHEEGLVAEVLDIGTAGSIAGRGAALGAKGGTLGKRAKRVALEPRARLQTAPGRSRPQRVSKNLLLAAGQKRLDRSRVKAQAKRARKSQEDPDRNFVRVEEAGGLPRNTITPRTKAGAKAARGRRFDEEQGRARTRMAREQSAEISKGSRKAIGKLSKPEQTLFAYGQIGVVSLKSPEAGIKWLDRREKLIKRNRKAAGRGAPKGRKASKFNDELKTIQYLREHAEEAFTPRLAEAVKGEQARGIRLAADDPALATQQAALIRIDNQAKVLGLKRGEQETPPAYIERVAKEAEKQGLDPEPGYFTNQAVPFAERRSDYALGTGLHGVSRGPKKRTGAAFDLGLIDVRPEIHNQALAKSIKRKHQWNFVIQNAEDNVLNALKTVDGETLDLKAGRTPGELVKAVDRSRLDPNDVAFVQVGKLRREAERGDGPAFEDDLEGQSAKAFEQNSLTYEEARRKADSGELEDDRGWHLVPIEIKKRQESVAQQGAAGRIIRKYLKGVPSKLLLGTNPSWAVLQMVNNRLMAGLGGVGELDIAKSAAFFKRHPEARKEVDAWLGATTFEAERGGTRIGAAAPSLRLIEEWRAFKSTPLAQKVGRGNPLDLLFRLDHANNTTFRRAVAYDFLKGEAYEAMGRDVLGVTKAMARLEHTFNLGPEKQLLELTKNADVLDEMGRHVDDLLGNYSRYSPLERKALEQNLMFYGFLRFSLRFTFWTLPFKHPVKAGILANLSRLHEQEVRRLLGLKKGDPLFPGGLASFYFIKNGKLREIPLNRLNPATNNLVQNFGPKGALLSLSPILLASANSAFHKNLFTGKDHKIRGETSARETPFNPRKYPMFDPSTVLEEVARLATPYRVAEEFRFRSESQGDDTNLLFPRPTKYKNPPPPDIANRIATEKKRGPAAIVLEQQVPLKPRDADWKRGYAERFAFEERTGKRMPKPKKGKKPQTIEEQFRSTLKQGPKSVADEYREFTKSRKKKSIRDEYLEYAR